MIGFKDWMIACGNDVYNNSFTEHQLSMFTNEYLQRMQTNVPDRVIKQTCRCLHSQVCERKHSWAKPENHCGQFIPEIDVKVLKNGANTMGNTDVNGAKKNVKDIVVFGNGDLFQLLSKASSENEGWMKSTKAMETPVGCVIQVTTQQRGIDLTYSVAEALTFVPGVKIKSDASGKQLVKIHD